MKGGIRTAYLFDDDFLDTLRQKCDIETVISRYVKLNRSGSTRLVGLCPFHNEKTPSFSVDPQKGFFHCFGCNAGGDVISFVMKMDNLSYVEAVTQLAESVGMEIPKRETLVSETGEKRKRILEMNRKAARFFHSCLLSEEGKEGLAYFRGRQLTDRTITRFGLGYSPDSWDSLLKYLLSEGYAMEDIKASGLVTVSLRSETSARGERVFDRFRNRVMFPIIDHRGNVIGFGGRTMGADPAKYLNTSATLVFNKGQNLFALNIAKNSAEKGLILCEGYMDVITLHQAGFSNAVATLGTALTPQQAKLMKRMTSDIVLCYDSDEAGRTATKRALEIFSAEDMRVKVITVPGSKDPDEYIKTFGAEGFRRLIEGSVSKTEYRLNEIKARHSLEIPEEKVAALKEMVAVLADIGNRMEFEVYARKLADEMEISPGSIQAETEKYIRKRNEQRKNEEKRKIVSDLIRPREAVNPQRSDFPEAAMAEDAVLTVLLNCPEYTEEILSTLSPDDFVTDFNRKLFRLLGERIPENPTSEPAMLLSQELTPEEMGQLSALMKEDKSIQIDRSRVPVLCDRLKKAKLAAVGKRVSGLSEEEMQANLARLREEQANRKKQN